MKKTMMRVTMLGLFWVALAPPGSATPILYDDFSGSVIDTAKWEVTQNPPGSQAYLNEGWLVMETYGDRRTVLKTKDTLPANHTLTFRFSRPEQHIGRNMTIRYGDDTSNYQYYLVFGDNGQMYAYSYDTSWGVRGTSPVLSIATSYVMTIETGVDSATIKLYDPTDSAIWNLTYNHPEISQEYKLEFNNYSHNTQTDENNPLTFALDYVEIIPEPGTAMLALLGLAALLGLRQKFARPAEK